MSITNISKSDVYLLITHMWFVGSFLNPDFFGSMIMLVGGFFFGILMYIFMHQEQKMQRLERLERRVQFATICDLLEGKKRRKR